jgi:hypothetical protein
LQAPQSAAYGIPDHPQSPHAAIPLISRHQTRLRSRLSAGIRLAQNNDIILKLVVKVQIGEEVRRIVGVLFWNSVG